LTEKLASEWRAERGPDWRRRHEEIQRRRARLVELAATASVTAEQSFEWGTLLEDEGRDEEALERYRGAHAAGHVAAGLAAGRLLLDRDDQSGIALIDAAMEADATLAERGCQAILDFLEDHGRHADAHRYQSRLNKAAAAAKIAQRERDRLSVVDRFGPCTGSEIDRVALVRVVQSQPAVQRAYLVTKEMRHSTGRQTVLAVFSKNGGLPHLATQLYEGRAVRRSVAVVVLGRHNELVEAAIREVTDALVFSR
jgi:hypothetical protein